MDRIAGATATPDRKFRSGDPSTGALATIVTPVFLNDVQEELVSLATATGKTPVAGELQVLKTLVDLFFPVGIAIDNKTATYNPNTVMPWTTWEKEYVGMVAVGQKIGDADFGTIGATLGSKAVKLRPNHQGSLDFSCGPDDGDDRTGAFQSISALTVNATAVATNGSGSKNVRLNDDADEHTNIQPSKVTVFWRRTA